MVPKWCPDVKNKVVKRKTATITRYKKSLCLQGFSQITYKKICGNTGRFWLFHDPRNQFASNRTWVRIPSSPPKSPVNSRVFWTFPFSRQGVDLAKNAGNPALFRLLFARLLEPAMPEKPYISRLFGVALIFLQELCLPALTFGVRKRKNIVHNVRGSDL